MSAKSPIAQYADLMREIKRRIEVVDFFLEGHGHALYQPTTTESICLQLRQVLELIAFSSLCANQQAYSAAHADFASHWNAEYLLRDLARINPDFYPKPVLEVPSSAPGVKIDHVERKDGFLTKDDFVKVYKKCGGMMHARNPYCVFR